MLQKTVVGKRDTGIPGKMLPGAGVTEVAAVGTERCSSGELAIGCYCCVGDTFFKDAAELTQAFFFGFFLC